MLPPNTNDGPVRLTEGSLGMKIDWYVSNIAKYFRFVESLDILILGCFGGFMWTDEGQNHVLEICDS